METILNEGGGGDDEQNVVQLKKTLSNNELPNVDEVVLENKDTHKISNAEYMLNDDGILQHKNTKKHKKARRVKQSGSVRFLIKEEALLIQKMKND